MKKIIIIQILIILILTLTGCNKNESAKILIEESKWNELGSNQTQTVFDEAKKGDVLSDTGFGTLTLKKVKSDYIIISLTEGFTEDVGKGINMNADDLTKIKVKKGENITVESKSFDAGISITIYYE